MAQMFLLTEANIGAPRCLKIVWKIIDGAAGSEVYL